ncbi:hypothetical protein BDK51DRAFT_52626 [Blyttiomyces helicus]|uniref:Uncharacterized protein n=1 Tax=Blyttiomyces helicus TaxID=388810 RepID=A0A4P9WIY2_9FUNG|nr:hypothetical protein BDK51DRAFT_52626 [Blyttiomyces helicus]|eukprot:RKO92861.1 hypothetical protein BDK51DRAFT_52626 [Blyttiomyces helicus]
MSPRHSSSSCGEDDPRLAASDASGSFVPPSETPASAASVASISPPTPPPSDHDSDGASPKSGPPRLDVFGSVHRTSTLGLPPAPLLRHPEAGYFESAPVFTESANSAYPEEGAASRAPSDPPARPRRVARPSSAESPSRSDDGVHRDLSDSPCGIISPPPSLLSVSSSFQPNGDEREIIPSSGPQSSGSSSSPAHHDRMGAQLTSTL